MDFCFNKENRAFNIRKRHLIYIAILSVLVSAISGCRPFKSVNERLDRAEDCMNSDPELSLRTIDTTDIGIIMPAVEYYRRHGTPTEKMRAYYYL